MRFTGVDLTKDVVTEMFKCEALIKNVIVSPLYTCN